MMLALYSINSLNSINTEQFVSDYYDINWTAPDLIKYINTEKTMPPLVCEDSGLNCTYSMSCDYTDDSNPNCFMGYDIPSFVDILINNTI